MFFDSWIGLFRVLIMGICAYFSMIVMLRISGKRTLSKMNAFDMVVTIALGSTLSTVLLSKDVALAEALFAFAVLISLQYAVAKAALKSEGLRNLVKSRPRVIMRDGKIDESAMQKERITHEEISAAIRGAGIADQADTAIVVLETDGSLSVIPRESFNSSPP